MYVVWLIVVYFVSSYFRLIDPQLAKVRENEAELLVQGCVMEIYGMVAVIFFIFTGGAGLMAPVLYFQWLRAKYFISTNCKHAFSQGIFNFVSQHVCK